MTITPKIFGEICESVARLREAGYSRQTVEATLGRQYPAIDASDLADTIEGVCEQWARLKITEA